MTFPTKPFAALLLALLLNPAHSGPVKAGYSLHANVLGLTHMLRGGNTEFYSAPSPDPLSTYRFSSGEGSRIYWETGLNWYF